MLISFSLENWMSFRDKNTISLVAGRQIKHRERLTYIDDYKLRILPILAIYGGNASGKSNIFKALSFAINMVKTGTKINEPIEVQPFLLSTETKNKPTSFTFEILVENTIYEYSFSATRERIHSEKLVEISIKKEKDLFIRDEGSITIKDSDNDNHLDFIKKGTRNNQLFLTNCIEQNNERYKKVYKWFSGNITLVKPEGKSIVFRGYIDKNNPLYSELTQTLTQLDTGVMRLGDIDIDGLNFDEIDENQRTRTVHLLGLITGDLYLSSKLDEKEKFRKLISYHKRDDDQEEIFDMNKESDGTKRLIELLPDFVLNDVLATKAPEIISTFTRVIIIDELDRSLHHLLLRRLIEKYLLSCNSNTRSQIIFTTHDLLLMDQSLFRRDEIYVCERDSVGASSIIPLNEYKGTRVDKDLLKSYTQGRFGGIPRL